jgi:hypothetical protein
MSHGISRAHAQQIARQQAQERAKGNGARRASAADHTAAAGGGCLLSLLIFPALPVMGFFSSRGRTRQTGVRH